VIKRLSRTNCQPVKRRVPEIEVIGGARGNLSNKKLESPSSLSCPAVTGSPSVAPCGPLESQRPVAIKRLVSWLSHRMNNVCENRRTLITTAATTHTLSVSSRPYFH